MDLFANGDRWKSMRIIIIANRNIQLAEAFYYMHLEDENIE